MLVSKSLRDRSPRSRSAWRCAVTLYTLFSSPPFLQHATSASRCRLRDWLEHLGGAPRTPARSTLQPCLNPLRWSLRSLRGQPRRARTGWRLRSTHGSLQGDVFLFPPPNELPSAAEDGGRLGKGEPGVPRPGQALPPGCGCSLRPEPEQPLLLPGRVACSRRPPDLSAALPPGPAPRTHRAAGQIKPGKLRRQAERWHASLKVSPLPEPPPWMSVCHRQHGKLGN